MITTDRRSLGRLNKPVLSSFTDTQLVKLWDDQKDRVNFVSNQQENVPFSPCHLWTGSLQSGYPSLSQGHGLSKIKIHMLAAWTTCKRLPDTNEVVSHLCHRKSCINPEHLIIESIGSNNKRIGCLHSMIDTQSVVWILCPHEKMTGCLRRDEDNINGFVPYRIV